MIFHVDNVQKPKKRIQIISDVIARNIQKRKCVVLMSRKTINLTQFVSVIPIQIIIVVPHHVLNVKKRKIRLKLVVNVDFQKIVMIQHAVVNQMITMMKVKLRSIVTVELTKMKRNVFAGEIL